MDSTQSRTTFWWLLRPAVQALPQALETRDHAWHLSGFSAAWNVAQSTAPSILVEELKSASLWCSPCSEMTLAPGCWLRCGRQPSAVSPTEVVWGGELPAQGQGTPHLMTRADIGIQRPAPSLHLGTALKSHPNFRTSCRIRTPHADCAAAPPLPPPNPAPLPPRDPKGAP